MIENCSPHRFDPGLYSRDDGPTQAEYDLKELHTLLRRVTLAADLAERSSTVELDSEPRREGDGYSFELKFWSPDAATCARQLRAMAGAIEREVL